MSDKRLFVVDDVPELGEAVGFLAEALEYECKVTTHGKDFMREYERFQPTAVVLDIVMPEIDGITLVRWLQQKSCSAKVLVASGANPDYADFAETIGDENGLNITRLSKPFVLKEFSAALAPTPDTVPAVETVREPVNDLLLQAMDQPKLSKGLNF